MTEEILRHMQSLNERQFTDEYVIPLFEEMGFDAVRYVGGGEEFGRDVLCYQINNAETRIDYGIQVKNDRIAGNASAQEVIEQARTAFDNPFSDETAAREQRYIGIFYVVTSHHITEHCRRIIRSGASNPIYFMDGRFIADKRRQQISTYLEYSATEVIMNRISFTDLLNDGQWIREADEMLVLLFGDRAHSPLQCINNLPNLLGANSEVSRRVEGLNEVRKKSVLHWLSIKLVLKAYYTLAKTSKFSVIEEVAR